MNVPKIRFKEFKDEWKEYEHSKILSENLIPIEKPKEDYWRLGLRSHYKGTFYEYVNPEKNNMDKLFLVRPNNFIINITFAWEQAYAITTDEDNDKIVSHRFPMYSFNSGFSHRFFKYRVDNKKFKYDLGLASPGGAGRNRVLNKSAFLRIKQYIPSYEEQIKIANMFELIDKKIELQSKKIEDLKLFKSSQINTKLANLKCEEVELKKIGYFISGNAIGKEKVTNNGIPLVLYGDLYTKYNEEITEINQYTVENNKYIKSEIGDLLFPTSTTVDALSLISPSSINIKGVVYGGDLIIFRTNNQLVDTAFLSYQINHYKRKDFSKKAQGSTIIHIHSEDLLNSKVKLPNIETQKSISKFGNKINKKIELETKKLKILYELKKGLMQNMFV